MNAYQEGVSHALGLKEANVGSPKQLFSPKDLMRGFGRDWFKRKLSSKNVAIMLHVNIDTVRKWRHLGWLKGVLDIKRNAYQYSLHDVENCVLKITTRKNRGNPVEYKPWTAQEIELLLQGYTPEGRSRQACKNKKHRLKKGAS